MDDLTTIWNRLAPFWDQQIGEGNDFQLQLINPTTLKLLALQNGDRVLELACGNGNFSRVLGRLGVKVLATDVSPVFIDCARQRTSADDGQIEYKTLDARHAEAFTSLPTGFDAVVCNMALMDLPSIDGLMRGVASVLKPHAPFVFSVAHPCFSSCDPKFTAELLNEAGRPRQVFGVQIHRYAASFVHASKGLTNQPEPHPIYHRSLSTLLADAFNAGFVVDAMEEPPFPAREGGNVFSWKRRPDLPPALVVRLRPSGRG
jgi:SAM-dependent methyltransferase